MKQTATAALHWS